MYKRLLLLISFVLVLGLTTPGSGDELLASYEESEMDDLTIKIHKLADKTLTVTRVSGGASGAPAAPDGDYILKWVWTGETDRKIEVEHQWTTRRLDLAPYNLITVDVWFDEPNAQPATIGIWNDDPRFWAGALSVPTGIEQWHTVEMDIRTVDDDNLDGLFAFLFEDLAGDAGVLYTDNMWLVVAPLVKAWRPIPFDGAVSQDPNVDLSWTAGIDANSHDVYFGSSFAEVNDADTSSPEFKGNQDPCSYELGTLERLTTYYWRIDEVNDADSNSPWKGDVWSFKTAPREYVEIPLTSYEDSDTPYEILGSAVIAGDEDWSLVVGDKLTGGDTWTHQGKSVSVPPASDGSKVLGLKWDDEKDLEVEHGIKWSEFTYDLYCIDELVFDIYYDLNDADGGFNPLPHSMGIFDWDFAPSHAGSSNLPETRGQWHTIVIDVSHLNNIEMDQILSFPFTEHGKDFDPNDEDPDNWGALVFMDNLRLRYPASLYATFPNPTNGATNVDLQPTLSWREGTDATSHDVYFGTALNEVSEATTSSPEFKGNQALANTSYEEPGLLLPSSTYYWRIDEVNDADSNSPWKGDVWSFTTVEYIPVDDFDSYASQDELWAVWDDYWVNGTGSAISIEYTVTYDGNSLEYEYDNANYDGSRIDALTSNLMCGSDWTLGNSKALTLYFYGDAGNTPTSQDKMYVALDGGSTVGVVTHPDVNEVNEPAWHEWNIDLQDYNNLGVVLSSIDKVHIGFGGSAWTGQSAAGTKGKVYFDEVRLHPPRCVPLLSKDVGDFTGDCVIDNWDLDIMAYDWLVGDYTVAAEAPDSNALAAYYEFEGDTTDSSGNGNDGDPCGDPSYVAGVFGQAIDLDGVDDYVWIPGSNEPGSSFDINEAITVAAWIKVTNFDKWYQTIISKGDDSWRLARYQDTNWLEFAASGISGGADPPHGNVIGRYLSVNDGSWHHAAGVYDGSKLYLYVDGMLDAYEEASGVINNNSYNVLIGANEEAPDREWDGLIDDVRVYNYGLSQAEIVSIMGESEVYQPVLSPANLYDEEPKLSKKVNFKDYAIMADYWLQEVLFPFE